MVIVASVSLLGSSASAATVAPVWMSAAHAAAEPGAGARMVGPESPILCPGGTMEILLGALEPRSGGAVVANGTVRSRCDVQVQLEVNGKVLLGSLGGRPATATRTARLPSVPPGALAEFSVSAVDLYDPEGYAVTWWAVATLAAVQEELPCWSVAASRCVRGDPGLVGSITTLAETREGRNLLLGAADEGIALRRAVLPAGVYGQFDARRMEVLVSTALDEASAWERAAVLAHELQHAADRRSGLILGTREGCYATERSATVRSAGVWQELWGGRLPGEPTRLQRELNETVRLAALSPEALDDETRTLYMAQCRALSTGG